jgi:uncharacterized protein YjbI with pentapeptide repeats
MSSVAARSLQAQAQLPPFTQPILDRLLEVHERFVKRQPGGRRAMIKYVQASRLNLSRRIMIDADFTGANFSRANLVSADFERASLYGADLRGADGRGANFTRADIRGATLRGANLSEANFDDADMRQAMLARTDSAGALELSGASSHQGRRGDGAAFSVDFSNCSMKGAKLRGAKLKGANFSGAVMSGAELKGADLVGAVFDGAILDSVALDGARIDAGALAACITDPSYSALQRVGALILRIEANRLWVATGGLEGRPANLDGEDLRPVAAAFAGRQLTALSARHVRAIGVSFLAAQLQGARFDGADLRDADFTSADLRGASFKGATLWHARFDGADLRPLPLGNGAACAVNLEGASFSKDCFDKSLRLA